MVHAVSERPMNPALQVQSASFTLPLLEYELAGHCVFVSPPGQNMPAGHLVQPERALPKYPALHTQSVELVLPGGLCELAGHCTLDFPPGQ